MRIWKRKESCESESWFWVLSQCHKFESQYIDFDEPTSLSTEQLLEKGKRRIQEGSRQWPQQTNAMLTLILPLII